MKSFYNILDSIKTVVAAEPFNNNISFGDISDIDLNKQSIFPLAHLMINNATINENHVAFNVTLFLMDIVDFNKEAVSDLFLGNNNIQDVLNTQMALGTRIIRVLQKKNLYKEQFELNNPPSCEPFTERFENSLAGWAITFDINTTDEMTYC